MSSKVRKTVTINGLPLSGDITLTKTDVGLGNVPNVDATDPSNLTQTASYRFATDAEKSDWNGKAETSDIDAAIAVVPNLSLAIVHNNEIITNNGEVVWVL